jgi:dTDP-4-dehydrorhamnose 3,5-epimerase
MSFSFTPMEIPEVFLIEPRVFPDERGFFMETYKHSEFAAHGIPETFVQCNHARSSWGILRGLHYQKNPKAQGKLVRVLAGEIYDIAVDIRSGSPTFGKWLGVSLSSENRSMLYVPGGFAHGYCVISESAEILYMATNEYAPSCEAGVVWNDPELRIPWPIDNPRLSLRDRGWPRLRDADNNFVYERTAAAT